MRLLEALLFWVLRILAFILVCIPFIAFFLLGMIYRASWDAWHLGQHALTAIGRRSIKNDELRRYLD